jgi:hypothetical protein
MAETRVVREIFGMVLKGHIWKVVRKILGAY